jgi:parallel beta-helix repeat protein
MLDSNVQNNIYVASSDNIIKDNNVTDSTNGIFFAVSGNAFLNNTGSGSSFNFNLNGTTQTTSTYMPNINF